jgi:copper chaperone CopZ
MKSKNTINHKKNNLTACCGGTEKIKSDSIINSSEIDKSTSVYISIDGMTCMSCVNRIENTLKNESGVYQVSVNLSNQIASIIYDPDKLNPKEISKAIEATGYGVVEINEDPDLISNQIQTDSSRVNIGPYPYLIGTAAALGVVAFYLGLLTLISDWYNAKAQFNDYRWWIIALSMGLGVQATLFSSLRIRLHGKNMKGAKTSLAASGGMSTASMAACCAHYLVAFLPALGLPFLSAAAAGLAEYQAQFFFVGVVSNLFGIGVMIRLMLKNKIISKDVFINRLSFGLIRLS